MEEISKEEQMEIDAKIDELYLDTEMSYPENSLLDISKSLNIEIHTVDFTKIEGMERVDGMVQYNPAKILISKHKLKQRNLFTLAHELGHFILHKANIGGRFRVDMKGNLTEKEDREEKEANYFAASLLVPKTEFFNLLSATKNIPDSLHSIADYFGVSKTMIKVRMRWLQRN